MDKLNDEIQMTPLKWKLQIPSSRLQTKIQNPNDQKTPCCTDEIWDLVFWAFKIMTVVLNNKGLATRAACAIQASDGNVS